MARLPHKRSTLQALFAKSGNLCAFPGCTHELVNAKNKFVAEICHIEAAEPGGARYNTDGTDEQRRSPENLLILCHRHHVETDDLSEFSVARLREMKSHHESANGKKTFKVDEALLFQIEFEMTKYWDRVERANRFEHVAPDFAVPISQPESPEALFEAIRSVTSRLVHYSDLLRESDAELEAEAREFLTALSYDLVAYNSTDYKKNPLVNRNWELHNLGIRNSFTQLGVLLLQTEILYLGEYLKTHPGDGVSAARFADAKAELVDLARNAGYAD